MKVPENYEPKNQDEFKTFDDTMKKLLSVPYTEVKKLIEDDKLPKKKTRVKRPKKAASPDEA